MVKLYSIPVGPLQANCHIIYCEDTKEAIVVDPGDEGGKIKRKIDELNATPTLILLTHGHGDHIGAVGFLKTEYNIPVLIHEKEVHMLTDPAANLSIYLGVEIASPPADQTFVEGDELSFCNRNIEILETEGHSPMGCSFVIGNHAITGDALFNGSIGRTDFPGGSQDVLLQRIKEKLLRLPDDTIVYPGHGPNTTIGDEKAHNPFLQ